MSRPWMCRTVTLAVQSPTADPNTRYLRIMTTTAAFMKGYAHGLRVGSTGNLTRLRRIRTASQQQRMLAESWSRVGAGIRRASNPGRLQGNRP